MTRESPRKLGCKANTLIWASVLMANGIAQASSYTGPVVLMRTNASQTTTGNIRVTIETDTATSCSSPGWYSYDLPEASVGKVWTAILLAALNSGRQVTLAGQGNCDPYGYEIVFYVDAR